MPNVTDSCKFKFYLQNQSTLFRSLLSATNSLTAFSTMALNSLILLSIWNTASLRKPSHLLIANLALADFLIGTIGQPLIVLRDILVMLQKNDALCTLGLAGKTLTYCLGSVSAFTLTVISIDRYLAIRLKISYGNVVTLKRVALVLLLWWIFGGVSIAYFFLWSGLELKTLVVLFCTAMASVLSIITMSYYRATRLLKKLLSEISPESSNEQISRKSNFDVSKYKRSLKTMIIVLVTIIAFYAPYFIVLVVHVASSKGREHIYVSHDIVWLEVLLFAHSTINPLVYLWRMRDLREAVKSFVRGVVCKARIQLCQN